MLGMPTSRSYSDACPIARALDVVGERWALLVVRELLFGPQRFSDLRRALPGASSNMLTDRLRELEGNGVVSRRRLPAPAASTVYDLTPFGRRLEPVLLALGAWGSSFPAPERGHLSATSVLLFLRDSRHPDPGSVYRISLDDQIWTVRTVDGEVKVEPGAPPAPDAGLHTDPATLNDLLADPAALASAVAAGKASITGDEEALRRLLSP
jgi:DNA-binding HxlR family transcriptional regulator